MIILKNNPKFSVLSPQDSGYPSILNDILTTQAKKIYVMGIIKDSDKKAIAIVGSRIMSDYGRRTAWKFSTELSKNGFTIVSGMARGIDSIAHEAALAAGGRTIAVLGSGIDVIYPPENKDLYYKISQKGAVISEFPPGTLPLAKNFLARNRIISALSIGVVVIEGKRKSGTISTASYAANQGKEVFAIPGPIDSPLSEAPNWLIENGARIVTSPEDILNSLL